MNTSSFSSTDVSSGSVFPAFLSSSSHIHQQAIALNAWQLSPVIFDRGSLMRMTPVSTVVFYPEAICACDALKEASQENRALRLASPWLWE